MIDQSENTAQDTNAIPETRDPPEGRLVALVTDTLAFNKAALFDALAAAGISFVSLQFDGYGDEGQVESVEAFDDDNVSVALPAGEIEIRWTAHDGQVAVRLMCVQDAVEFLAFDCLWSNRGGWENGEGAYGEFRFDAVKQAMTLDYNERYVASELHEYIF